MQFEKAGKIVEPSAETERRSDSIGGNTGRAGELPAGEVHDDFARDAPLQRGGERQGQEVTLEADLLRDAHERRVRPLLEPHVGDERTGVVADPGFVRVDRVELERGRQRRGQLFCFDRERHGFVLVGDGHHPVTDR